MFSCKRMKNASLCWPSCMTYTTYYLPFITCIFFPESVYKGRRLFVTIARNKEEYQTNLQSQFAYSEFFPMQYAMPNVPPLYHVPSHELIQNPIHANSFYPSRQQGILPFRGNQSTLPLRIYGKENLFFFLTFSNNFLILLTILFLIQFDFFVVKLQIRSIIVCRDFLPRIIFVSLATSES